VALVVTAVGGLLILLWRYSSLASLTVAGLLPVLCVAGVLCGAWPASYLVFALLTGAFAVWELRANIARLRSGTERRVGQSSDDRPAVP
jgi:glycerol-3-phosphate acyltransferase PlsY